MYSSKITIVSPFFFPEKISTGKYNGVLAEGLVAEGFQVGAICSHPLYPKWQPEIANEEMPGVTAHRGGGWIKYPKNPLLRRLALETWFTFHVARSLLSKKYSASTFIVIFPPSLFMLALPRLLPRQTNIIGIVHDLQGVFAAKRRGLLGRLLQNAISAAESRAFLACDHLVFLSRTMLDLTASQYPIDISKASVGYPFVTIDARVTPDTASAVDIYFDPSLKSIVYSGALGEKQAPQKLARLMHTVLEAYPDWQARIFSQGPLFDEIQKEFQHPRLRYYPLVDGRLLPALLAKSDVQIVPQEIGTADGSLPSKVPNIMASGSRLLCITDPGSELANLVNDYEAGQVVTSWDIQKCVTGFEQLIGKPKAMAPSAAKVLRQFTLGGLIETIKSVIVTKK